MDFAILGPLEVRHDGRPVPIPGRHAPKLLAVLLLDAGRLVTVPRLVETLWGDNPPETARRQVQNVMAALRRALPVPEAIEASANGYRLILDGNTLDHREFERLRAEARQAQPRQAARQLADALRLWRGFALSGLTGNVIEAAAAKLDEERLAVVEDRIEREFELDRNGDAAAQLRDLVEAHPYRQRLAGLLMRAHWYAGRTPEALAVYEQTRERLAADLGLDPALDLVRLHTAILRGEPDRDPPRAAVTGPVPAQLPAAPTTFTGRREHVAELDELLEHGGGAAVVSAIAGMGGAGKTALALHWGHRVRDRFPDGQLYINLRGYDDGEPVAPIDALGRFLVALGKPSASLPPDVDSASTLFRALIADRRMLVVLDNARAAEQVRPLLPGGAGNFALVTSRDRMAGLTAVNDAKPIRLDTLSRDESLELLANIVGAQRLHGDPEAAWRIAELCGRLPLALRIAAANLAAQPEIELAAFADTLAGPNRLDHLDVDGDPRASVSHALELSVAAIDAAGRRLFHRLGAIPGEDFGRDLAVHLSEMPQREADDSLSRMETAHLLERYRADRFRFHDLVRDYARSRRETSKPQETVARVQDRFIDWHYDNLDSLPSDESTNVLSALQAWGDYPRSWKLAACLHVFCDASENAKEMLSLVGNAIRHAEQDADPEGLARTYHSIAHIHDAIGNQDETIRLQRMAVSVIDRQSGGDRTGRYYHYLAAQLSDIGQLTEAKKFIDSALQAAIRDQNPVNIAKFASSAGGSYRQEGSYTEAEAYFQLGMDHTPIEPLSLPRVALLGELATLYRDMGRYSQALESLDKAISWTVQNGNSRLEILGRILRADILIFADRSGEARSEVDAARLRAEQTGRVAYAFDGQIKLAEIEVIEGHFEKAAILLRELDQNDNLVNNVSAQAEIARTWCYLHNQLDQPDEAITHGQLAADLYASVPWPLKQARCLAALGIAYERKDDPARAAKSREQALEIFTRLGVPEADEVRQVLEAAPPH